MGALDGAPRREVPDTVALMGLPILTPNAPNSPNAQHSPPILAPITMTPINATELSLTNDPYARPGWVLAENAKPGTSDWRLPETVLSSEQDSLTGWIEGYADATSVQAGHDLTLFVDTPATTFTVLAYRMGWYGGAQGRLIWTSPPTPGGRQLKATFDQKTGTAEAPWHPSMTVPITSEWPPGQYLLKLVSDKGGTHYVPLTVRDDHAAGGLLIVSAVTTWQAYNPWGGCSLYACAPDRHHDRAQVVSFNRPYSHEYQHGSADFLDHELPLVSLTEQVGLDAEYVTDIDLHQQPELASARHAVITLGHDEYYSTPMRDALEAAVAHGVNVAFFGANAVYRHIRFSPDATGRADRVMANYREQIDPMARVDPQQATVQWRNAPLRRPEATLIGVQYGCAGVHVPMRLVNTRNWIFTGTGATDKQKIANLVGVEFDELAGRSFTPAGLEVLAASPVTCRGQAYQHVMSYYSNAAGAGVFATGTINWICAIDGSCAGLAMSPVVRGATWNVLREFADGPAGVAHPSTPNANKYRTLPTPPPGTTPEAGPSTPSTPTDTGAKAKSPSASTTPTTSKPPTPTTTPAPTTTNH